MNESFIRYNNFEVLEMVDGVGFYNLIKSFHKYEI